jgi:hypothetical protein
MSTIKTTTLSTQGGSTVPVDTVVNGTAKAWVNFDGTGTVAIRRAFNVSSITDNGVGVYAVNFTTAMVDADYARIVSKGNSGAFVPSAHDDITTPTTSSFRLGVRSTTGTYTDIEFIHAAIFS